MSRQTLSLAAKDLVETSRKTLGNAVETTRDSVHEALRAYDRAFTASSDTLLRVQNLVGTSLRDDLVSLEGQLTLIANVLATAAADEARGAINRAAESAARAAGGFEKVFDLGAMQALDRIGLPAGEMVRELAERVATLAQEVDRLLKLAQSAQRAPAAASGPVMAPKAAPRTPRGTAKRTGKKAG